MISRTEFLYVKDKIKKLSDLLFQYETTSPVYQAWDRWLHLTPQEKEEEKERWNSYYKQCKESFWGKAFFWIKEKFYSHTLLKNTIKQLKDEAKRRGIKPIKKPEGEDPEVLLIKINPYYQLKSKLEDYKKIYEEYKAVYDKKNDIL